ncbi:MAG: hypothetical protein HRU38_08590 [Saccharospirillaceae bacterium]|nr:hypothetical protein [Pseudomonadales bacterium]NRB78711.1 hypothetical protein [Saccharospirillaceae bacterium]
MKISNTVIETRRKNKKIIREMAIKLVVRVKIVDSPISSYLLGYSDLTHIEAVSKWITKNWKAETIKLQDQFLNTLESEIKNVLIKNAHKMEMPWIIGEL